MTSLASCVDAFARDVVAMAMASDEIECALARFASDARERAEHALARCDECDSMRARARRASMDDDDDEALKQDIQALVRALEQDYALIDSVGDALTSAERALEALEAKTSARERRRGRETMDDAYEAVMANVEGVMAKVSAITETLVRANRNASTLGGEREATSPREYYFGDDDDGAHDEAQKADIKEAFVAKANALQENARGFVGSLSERLSRFANVNARGARAEDDENARAAEPSSP